PSRSARLTLAFRVAVDSPMRVASASCFRRCSSDSAVESQRDSNIAAPRPSESFSGAARRAIRCRLSKTQGQRIIYQPHQQASTQLLVIQIVAELAVPSEYPGPLSRVTTTL